ncbi:MAG: polyribonucleotide nucleotidyltransferase [Elusimicrobia bacterium RIFOXYA2_FULL_50_26]|nr:MAG: polyribonucleotide nucleotidyltransferase [Elusimicrobia bacterium RIFOXYA2_FULL_50_26]OGS24574.1 MAG: polyribonucleotide nucleotidyltransferase [Elusimicrobia bacterium RIFOXYB2_FULL_50_12]
MRKKENIVEKTSYKLEIGGKTFEIDMGSLAKQAGGSCRIRVGDTVILVTTVASREPKTGIDFLPLTVDFRERTYAAGKIPGGFFKREGRPREKEILTSRLIDRSIRPLFPENWNNETQVISILLSTDNENEADIPSIMGASIALMISDIPYNTPIAAVRVGKIGGQLVINPTATERKGSTLDLVVSGTAEGLAMVESGSQEVSESEILEALSFAHTEIKKICAFQLTLPKTPKIQLAPVETDQNLVSAVKEMAEAKAEQIVSIAPKKEREDAWYALKKEVKAALKEKFPEQEGKISAQLEDIFYRKARALILGKKLRSDGRKFDEIRRIDCETTLLPRAHGSGLFTRGQTQALATVTLGSPDDMQIMDELAGEYKERFMLHYNFPGFATGEAKPERSPGRREIGHGALAKRSLTPLLPSIEEFPYAVRIVSDVLESNGSSSMATVCGGSLALFDAGVPMKSSCAGVAMGLIKEGNDYAILTDIMGMEDHLGDMDFKVAGTRKGITALQMDIKVTGLTTDILAEALESARTARLTILDIMNQAISLPKADLSAYAPRMVTLTIPQSKIGELIGPGGKNIRRIQEETGAEVSIEDDGRVFISSPKKDAVDLCRQMVEYYTADVEVGKVYKGKVTRILNFGAFVEILPGKEGLVHISQLAESHVKKVEDVVSEGDEVTVKVVEIDTQGRVNLSRKAVLNLNK